MRTTPTLHAALKVLGVRPSQLTQPRPCAYCGDLEHWDIVFKIKSGAYHTSCDGCGYQSPQALTVEDAIRDWNTHMDATRTRILGRVA